MSTRPFDTYEYVQELMKGGFSQQLAEANMHALVKALDFTLENHVIAKLDQFVTKDEFKQEIQQVRDEIQQVEHRLEAKILNLDHKIDKIFLKMMVSMGGMITIACSFLSFVIKF